MNTRIAQFLTITLASFGTLSAGPAEPPQQTASTVLGDRPGARELLQRFADEQAKLSSFIAQYEFDRQDSGSGSLAWKGSQHGSGETRYDGPRCSARERMWGQIVPSLERPKDKPYYKSCLLDGQWRYGYDQAYWRLEDAPKNDIGLLMLGSVQEHFARAGVSVNLATLVERLHMCSSGLTLFFGELPGDGKRFDAQIRSAASLRVRDQPELAGVEPSLCYVLEADTAEGQYTVWLDPAHGFQMARAILLRRPGHKRGTWTLVAGERDLGTVDKVRFANKNGVWVPVEASGGLDNTYDKVGNSAKPGSSSMRFQSKITRFIPSPDHAALRSFLPDDIRDGATTFIHSATNASGGLIKGQWRDGKAVDPRGKVIFDSGLTRTNSANSTPGGKR